MKLGIMQPYFFPYLGYWQLINAVDKFVLLDDVNFITRGYINRNSILLNGQPYKFSMPLDNQSQNKLINETKLKFCFIIALILSVRPCIAVSCQGQRLYTSGG